MITVNYDTFRDKLITASKLYKPAVLCSYVIGTRNDCGYNQYIYHSNSNHT